jgi:hypothetical protein
VRDTPAGTRDAAAAERVAAVCLLSLLLLSLCASPALARSLGGRGTVRAAPVRAAEAAPVEKPLELGFYLTPLLGYESNYTFSPDTALFEAKGSGMWALEGGGELKYRRSEKLRMRGELAAMVRMPFSDGGLTEFLTELPVVGFYRLTDSLELFLSNHIGVERSRTPPVFLESGAGTVGETLTYFAFYETLRPALAYHLREGAFVEAAPYFRVKQINFSQNLAEPDYRLFDLGLDVSGKVVYKTRFAARLRYDYARRMFQNLTARTPDGNTSDSSLAMNRHIVGVYGSGHVFGPLSLDASYAIRIVRDNGGYYAYNDHLVGGGLELSWPELVTVSGGVFYQRRGYSDRTPCEGGTCDPTNPAATPFQSQVESAVTANAKVLVTITDWLQAIATYELEDASSDAEDVLVPNHRVMAGVSLFL